MDDNGYTDEQNGQNDGYQNRLSRKRPRNQENSSSSSRRYQGGDEPLLKLLVPIYAAGALIGKKGALLAELKTKYGGNIRISAGKEHYPGTDERIIILTGTTEEILGLNKHIMEKVENPGRDGTMRHIAIDDNRSRKVKIVLTNLTAGLLIGKGGNTIKNIQTNTRAKISIAPINEGPVPGERVLTISGSLEDRDEACKKVAEVIAKDTSNMGNTTLKYPGGLREGSGPPLPFNLPNIASNNAPEPGGRMNDFSPIFVDGPSFNNRLSSMKTEDRMDRSSLERALMDSIAEKLSAFTNSVNTVPQNSLGPIQNGVTNRFLNAKVEMTVEVPQRIVGGVLGKQGSIVKEMSRNSGGAKFKFADKSDNDTSGIRNLTITGDVEQAYKAYNLVSDRAQQLVQDHQQQHSQGRDDQQSGSFRPRSHSPQQYGGDIGYGRDRDVQHRGEERELGRRQSDFALQGFLNSY